MQHQINALIAIQWARVLKNPALNGGMRRQVTPLTYPIVLLKPTDAIQ